jgi:hypothetical protein
VTIPLLLAFAVMILWWTGRAVRTAVRERDMAPLIGVGLLWVCVILTFIAANHGA